MGVTKSGQPPVPLGFSRLAASGPTRSLARWAPAAFCSVSSRSVNPTMGARSPPVSCLELLEVLGATAFQPALTGDTKPPISSCTSLPGVVGRRCAAFSTGRSRRPLREERAVPPEGGVRRRPSGWRGWLAPVPASAEARASGRYGCGPGDRAAAALDQTPARVPPVGEHHRLHLVEEHLRRNATEAAELLLEPRGFATLHGPSRWRGRRRTPTPFPAPLPKRCRGVPGHQRTTSFGLEALLFRPSNRPFPASHLPGAHLPGAPARRLAERPSAPYLTLRPDGS